MANTWQRQCLNNSPTWQRHVKTRAPHCKTKSLQAQRPTGGPAWQNNMAIATAKHMAKQTTAQHGKGMAKAMLTRTWQRHGKTRAPHGKHMANTAAGRGNDPAWQRHGKTRAQHAKHGKQNKAQHGKHMGKHNSPTWQTHGKGNAQTTAPHGKDMAKQGPS